MKKLGWISLSLVLLLIMGVASADSTVPTFSSDAVANHTDLSVSYLGQIFGNVGNVLQGNSGQMLGKLLYEFNFGILIIAGVWLIGTTLMVTIRSATEGSFMGQNNKVPLIILRVAFGIILLIPNAETGYSLAQDLMMKVVVSGVELGNMVWNYGLDYLNDGGQLWVTPVTNDNGTPQLLTDDSLKGSSNGMGGDGILGNLGAGAQTVNSESLGLAQRVFASEVCMVASTIQLQQPPVINTQGDSVIVPTTNNSMSSFTWYEDDDHNVILFPGGSDDPNAHNDVDFNSTAGYSCGYVSWDAVQGAVYNAADPNTCKYRGNNSAHGSGSHCEFSRLAIVGLVNDLMPAAKQYACARYSGSNASASAICTGTDGTNLDDNVVNALYNATLHFSNAITPLANSQISQANTSSRDFVQMAKDQGWATAGRFYWDLVHMQSLVQQVSQLNAYVPSEVNKQFTSVPLTTSSNSTPGSAIMSPFEDAGSNETPVCFDSINDICETIQSFYGDLTKRSYTNNTLTQISHESTASGTGSVSGGSSASLSNSVVNLIPVIGPIIGDINNLANQFQSSAIDPDPILFLSNVGKTCMDIAGDIWFGPIPWLFVLYFGAAFCTGLGFDGEGVIANLMSWVKPLFMAMALACFAVGALLSVYIPLYPYIIWVCSLIGSWLIPVIEVMVAMPIIALGITNSQGHDIWGRAEHAINMILLILIRPALLVIGLIASMILSFVGLKMVVYGFSGIAYDLFTNGYSGHYTSDPSIAANAVMANSYHGVNMNYQWDNAGLGVRLLMCPLFMMAFAFIVLEVTIQCYKLVYSLGNVINYIGGRSEHHGIDNMVSGVHQSVSAGGNKLGQGFGSMDTLKPMKGADSGALEVK